MNTEQILMCVVALVLGMLLANMLKNVCGCKVVEGQQAGVKTTIDDDRGFALVDLLRLRQICCDPRLAVLNNENTPENPELRGKRELTKIQNSICPEPTQTAIDSLCGPTFAEAWEGGSLWSFFPEVEGTNSVRNLGFELIN